MRVSQVGAEQCRVVSYAFQYALAGRQDFGFGRSFFYRRLSYGRRSFTLGRGVLLGIESSWIGVAVFRASFVFYLTILFG